MTRQRDLYIAKVAAGSKQDELRDFNRVGYTQAYPWRESPTPVFEGGAAVVSEPVVRPHTRRRRESWMDILAEQMRRDTLGAVACILLCAVLLLLGVAWGRQICNELEMHRQFTEYQADTRKLNDLNDALSAQLEAAKSGERIRNLARNELGMLRRESAEKISIYVQASDVAKKSRVQENEEPKFEVLDFMLGLLNVFDFKE